MWRLPLLFLLFALLSLSQPAYFIDTVAGSDPNANAIALEDVRGVAADSSGNLYVSDAARHRIVRITVSGEMFVIAGTGKPGFSGDGGPAESAELNQPYGLTLDSSGNIYIADLQNARVRRIDPSGHIATIAGGGTLSPVHSSTALAIALKAPRNVAIDPAGNLFVSDFLDHRVLRISPDGRLTVFAGTGSPGTAIESAPATSGALSYPAGLHASPSGELYVADSGNHAIRRITSGTMTRVPIQNAASFVHLPVGICLDPSGKLYIASTGFDQVVQLASSGEPIVLAQEVRDVACDGTGNVYIVSAGTARKRHANGTITTLAGAALRFRGEGSPAARALLNMPNDVKMDAAGAFYIADTANHRVRKVASGIITTLAGDGGAGFSGDDGPAARARLFRPQSIAVSQDGTVYIADTQNHRVRKVTPNGVIATVAGTGLAGFNGDSRPALEAQLHTPSAVAVDANGTLYIADTGNHRIRRITASGFLLTIAGSGGRGYAGDGEAALGASLDTPMAMVFDATGNLLFADQGNRRIRKISPLGAISTVVSNAAFPTGLAVDAEGALFFSDAATHSILAVNPTGAQRTIAGTGERGFSGDRESAQQARLNAPSGLAIDKQGHIYVADSANHRIRKLTPAPVTPPPSIPPPVVEETPLRVWHGAILEPTAAAPGMLLTLQGPGIGPPTPLSGTVGTDGVLASTLGDSQVRFDGKPAPILYAQDNLINVQAPFSIAGQASTKIEIFRAGQSRGITSVAVKAFVPGIFTAGSGVGPANALNEDLTVNQSANPAARGALVTFYATGHGVSEPALTEGKLAEAPYPIPAAPIAVSLDGQAAEVTAMATALTSPGVLQITLRVPSQAASGPVPLILTVGGVSSQAGVTIFVR